MDSYTKRGRLTRPIHKLLVRIRWMGCSIAVYDAVIPCESGAKGRKVPADRRNRRGTRSRRGGLKRKRRALTGAAPVPPVSRPSKGVVSERKILMRMRTFDYSRRIIDSIKKCGEDVFRTRKLLNRVDGINRYSDLYNGYRRHFLKLCKQWRDLRVATHGEPSFAIEYAFALEVGDDIPFRGNITKVRSLVPFFAPAKQEIVQAIPISATGDGSENAEITTYWCTVCARSTNLRFCRRCGGELAPPVRRTRSAQVFEDRRRVPKGPRPPVVASSTSSRNPRRKVEESTTPRR